MKLNEAYKIILTQKEKLHSEYHEYLIDKSENQGLKANLENQFFQELIKYKNYYSAIFFMNSYVKEKKSLFNSTQLIFDTNKQIPDIFETEWKNDKSNFLETILKLEKNKALSPAFIDFITYSIIPSLYYMFIDDKSFDLFCNLIKSLKLYYENGEIEMPLHIIFSKSFFVSPIFLEFIRDVIYQIFMPFYNEQKSTNFDNIIHNYQKSLQDKILQSFDENISFFPSIVSEFFQKIGDIKPFLVGCLFKPLIENPAIFLVVDSWITDFEDKMDDIRKLLQSVFTDELIERISQLISKNILLIQSYNSYDINQIIDYKIFNSIDHNAIILINEFLEKLENKNGNDNGGKNKKIDVVDSLNNIDYKICLLYCKKHKDEQVENQQNDYFTNLLISIPPLPPTIDQSSEALTKTSFLKIFKDSLTYEDDPFKFANSKILIDLLERDIMKSSDDIKIIIEKVPNLVFKNTELQKREILNKMTNKSEKNFKCASKAINLNEILYNTIITRLIHPPQNILNRISSPRFKFDILTDPIKACNQFLEYCENQIKNTKEMIRTTPQIFFHRFYHQLSFADFCAYRTDLVKYDLIMQDIFTKYTSLLNIKYNDILKQKAIHNLISHIDLLSDFYFQLNKVFEYNSDPLNKLEEINEVMTKMVHFFENNFRSDGENDIFPFRIISFAFANPPRFISNLIYILEYVDCLKNKEIISVDLQSALRNIQSIQVQIAKEMNCRIFDQTSIYFLSRMHHRFVDFFISGNNSNSIINLLNKLFELTNNQPPSDQDMQNYEKLIDKNSGKIYTRNLSFSEISNKTTKYLFFHHIKANIYFGKNIEFRSKSDSECNLKIALYFYKYKKPNIQFVENLLPETNYFVKNNKVDDKNKVFIYDDNKDKEHIMKEVKTQKINMSPFESLAKILNSLLCNIE